MSKVEYYSVTNPDSCSSQIIDLLSFGISSLYVINHNLFGKCHIMWVGMGGLIWNAISTGGNKHLYFNKNDALTAQRILDDMKN